MTTTTVKLNGKTVRLQNTDVIGAGGEATVFQYKGQALKIYLNPTQERAEKLKALQFRAQTLPTHIIGPQALLYDKSGKNIVGFAMKQIDAQFVEIRHLSRKKYRAQTNIHSRDVAQLFLSIHQTLAAIHNANMVVGDLNDLNIMFQSLNAVFIDVDSFQFDTHPCMVGTEPFLDPNLYNIDLASHPHFTPENDWYAFAVLLFKSMLLAHPYGGVHPTIQTLTQRAQKRIPVFDTAITYPRIAYPMDLLSDTLAHTFEGWFRHGQRGIFPESDLHDYIQHSTTCPSCQTTYPTNRSRCPICSTLVPVSTIATDSIAVQTIIHTQGDIIAWHVSRDKVQVLAHEQGKVIYYTAGTGQPTQRSELFNVLPQATYRFIGDVLVIAPDNQTDTLMLVDLSTGTPKPITQTTTELYSATTPIFSTSGHTLYRSAGGYLVRGEVKYGQLVEQSVMSITHGQTWFTANPHGDGVFGFFRIFNDYQYWLLIDGERHDIDLQLLAQGESLIDISVKFTRKRLLIQRLTRHQGNDRVLTDEITTSGQSLYNAIAPHGPNDIPIHTAAYMEGILVSASDKGIVQHNLQAGNTKTFPQTEPVVRLGDTLYAYQKGILAVQDRHVQYITMGSNGT